MFPRFEFRVIHSFTIHLYNDQLLSTLLYARQYSRSQGYNNNKYGQKSLFTQSLYLASPPYWSYTTHSLRSLASGPLNVIILNDINIYINKFFNTLTSDFFDALSSRDLVPHSTSATYSPNISLALVITFSIISIFKHFNTSCLSSTFLFST